ncbi:MAG: hypothetical protein ABFD89_03680 [Bryobacteraceae bacterium]
MGIQKSSYLGSLLFVILFGLGGCRQDQPIGTGPIQAVLPPLVQAGKSVESAKEKADKLPTSELKGGILSDLDTASDNIKIGQVNGEKAAVAAKHDADLLEKLNAQMSIVSRLIAYAAIGLGLGLITIGISLFVTSLSGIVRSIAFGVVVGSGALFIVAQICATIERAARVGSTWFAAVIGVAAAVALLAAVIDYIRNRRAGMTPSEAIHDVAHDFGVGK